MYFVKGNVNSVDTENEVESFMHNMIQHNIGVVHKLLNIVPFLQQLNNFAVYSSKNNLEQDLMFKL